MGVSAAGPDPRRTRRRGGGRGEAPVPRRASRRPRPAPARPLGPVGLVPEDLVGEPLPGPGDAVLALDGRRVAEQLPGEVIGGEVAAHLAGPPGAVLDRVARL